MEVLAGSISFAGIVPWLVAGHLLSSHGLLCMCVSEFLIRTPVMLDEGQPMSSFYLSYFKALFPNILTFRGSGPVGGR